MTPVHHRRDATHSDGAELSLALVQNEPDHVWDPYDPRPGSALTLIAKTAVRVTLSPPPLRSWTDRRSNLSGPQRCDLEAMKVVARRFFPPPPENAPSPPKLWEPGVLEEIADAAGLRPEAAFDVSYAFEYPVEEIVGPLMLAPAGLGAAAGPDRGTPCAPN